MLNLDCTTKAEISRADYCPWKNRANHCQFFQKIICQAVSLQEMMKLRFLDHPCCRRIDKPTRLEQQILREHNKEHRNGSSFQGILEPGFLLQEHKVSGSAISKAMEEKYTQIQIGIRD